MQNLKIAIIGAGAVGVSTAYALMLNNLGSEIFLVDVHQSHTEGEALDLQDTLAFSKVSRVQQASIEQAREAQIIIITAGVAQESSQTRLSLLAANAKVMHQLADSLSPLNPETLVLVATNPVDIMTRILQETLNHPYAKVIGSGTLLDSQRLRGFIADKLAVAKSSVHAYVLGEHGDSQFPAWSCAYIGGCPLSAFVALTEEIKTDIAQATKRKAYDIISRKGATYYGIAACLARICQTMIYNKKHVLPLSIYVKDFRTCLSMPVVLGREGIEQILPIVLSEKEQTQLQQSATILQQNYKNLLSSTTA